jgi:gas vesicle protein
MTEETRTGFSPLGIIAAAVGGAVAGGVAALLLAPKNGRETRRMITDAVERQKEKAARLGIAAREASTAAKDAFSHTMAGGH